MTPANDIGFHLNKACADGNLMAVDAYASQWDGLTFGKFLSTAVQANKIDVVEYLLERNNLPSEVARAMDYAVDCGHWDLIPVLAEYLDDYFCGVALERAARIGKTVAVDLLAPFSPSNFILTGLTHALLQKHDAIIGILAPLRSCEDIRKHLFSHGNPASRNYYTQWLDNHTMKKVLTAVVEEYIPIDCVKRKI